MVPDPHGGGKMDRILFEVRGVGMGCLSVAVVEVEVGRQQVQVESRVERPHHSISEETAQREVDQSSWEPA